MPPSGPSPRIWRVRLLSAPLSWLPIMEQASSERPSAAVAVGLVWWISCARATISVPVMAEAITKPSVVMIRTISPIL